MGFKTFIGEIFQDVDDGFSAKRTGFFAFIILLTICVLGAVFLKVNVPDTIFNGLVDLIKWIGAAILGERMPAVMAATRKGTGKE